MNLLVEQRRSSIPSSSKSQTPSSSPLSDQQNDMNNSSSAASSSLVLKIKRQTAREQQQGSDSSSTSSRMAEDDGEHEEDTADTSNHSRSSSQMQRSKRPNSNSTARRPSSPAFNGKQASKRSVTIDNNNNDLPSHLDESSRTKRFKSNDSTQSSSSKVDASVETVSVGLATEPDHLGPCEPGTSVVLEGIVWNETDSGVLVVNVTWRGKTYVGTLLDSTKQDWACPRLTCESPTSDYDPRSSNKTSRSKRGNAGGNSRSSNHQASASSFQQITSIILASGSDDRKLRHNIKSRQSKRLNQLPSTTTDDTTSSPSPLSSPYRTNQTFFPPETATSSTTTTTTTTTQSTSNGEPSLLPCTEANCHKRFASSIALSYHVSDAHQKSELPSSTNVSQASTRDEEDVAHILANVAHYARRSSPPSSMRSSPERAQQEMPSPSLVHSPPLPPARTSLATSNASTLTWPCPQISSKLVQPAALNNDERPASPSSASCPNAHPGICSASNLLENQSSSPSPSTAEDSTKKDRNNHKKRSKLPSPPPASSFVPIPLLPTIPPTASSPAYSDISDEDPTTSTTNSHEQILPPSTINLLAASNGKLDENGNQVPSTSFLSSNGGLTHADISTPAWTAQMLFQQFGPYLSQPALVPTPTAAMVSSNHKETSKNSRSTTPNGLNSKTHCSSPNDSTVKNILDARRSSTIKSSSSTSPPINLYHFHPNGGVNETKFSPSIINTLTSPNENLLHPSTSIAPASTTPSTTNTTLKPMDILDYSLTPSHSTSNGQYPHSSSLHPSR